MRHSRTSYPNDRFAIPNNHERMNDNWFEPRNSRRGAPCRCPASPSDRHVVQIDPPEVPNDRTEIASRPTEIPRNRIVIPNRCVEVRHDRSTTPSDPAEVENDRSEVANSRVHILSDCAGTQSDRAEVRSDCAGVPNDRAGVQNGCASSLGGCAEVSCDCATTPRGSAKVSSGCAEVPCNCVMAWGNRSILRTNARWRERRIQTSRLDGLPPGHVMAGSEATGCGTPRHSRHILRSRAISAGNTRRCTGSGESGKREMPPP